MSNESAVKVNQLTNAVKQMSDFLNGKIVDNTAQLNDVVKTNQWKGKKVVWLGTSVSFGQYATTSYAVEASNKLGFILKNCSVPGLAIHTKPDGKKLQYG